jgi:hypothetical protein
MRLPIDRLAAPLADHGVSREQLVSALYVLRAHRSLRGIGLAIQHFFRLAEKFKGLKSCSVIDGYDARLEVLRLVEEVSRSIPEFNATALKGRDLTTQLRPYCGDSAIADMLLVWHGGGSQDENKDFDTLVAWFIWHGIRFNRQKLSEAEYSRYLLSDDAFRLLDDTKDAGQLYNAGLKIRKLGDPSSRNTLIRAVALGLELEEPSAKALSRVLRFGSPIRSEERDRLIQSARNEPGYDKSSFLAQAKATRGIFDPAVRLFLCSIWWSHLIDSRNPGVRVGGEVDTRKQFKPALKRAPSLTEVVTTIDEGIQGGVVVDFIPTLLRDPAVDANDDPDMVEGTEPTVSVFLGDGNDLIKAYYASKGLQNAIEYGNAMLPWAYWRLSREAMDAVLGLVKWVEGASDAEQMARLAIGMCLLSGRPLEAVALPVFGTGVALVTRDKAVAVTLAGPILTVFGGTPKLKKKVTMTDLCDPHEDAIRLPLPVQWQALIEHCSRLSLKKGPPVVATARKLLKQLPAELGVTEKAIRTRLPMELLRLSKGDLGLVKLITDSNEANLQNLIHYSSYRTAVAEGLWHQAASALHGPLPAKLPVVSPDARVGAPHGFNVDKLRGYFDEMQRRFNGHVQAKRWRETFNYLTMRTAQRLALATAGRRTVTPIPRILLQGDNWAFVDDKHLSDGSTDRLNPFSDGLKAQLAAYVAFASHLALTNPRLEPFEKTADGWELRLWYVAKTGEVRPYQPLYQENDRVPKKLPGNWARKLVRSEATELYGRMSDAGSGHAVRGRHPYRYTSTLSTPSFAEAWIGLQASLESRLGMVVLVVPGFESTPRRFRSRLPGGAKKVGAAKGRSPAKSPTLPDRLVLQRLELVDADLFNAVFETSPPGRAAALQLIRMLIKQLYDNEKSDLALWAESACTLIRSKTKLPIFASRPRPRFARDWLLERDALRTLAWFEEHVLPKFEEELRMLPAPRPGECGPPERPPPAEWDPSPPSLGADHSGEEAPVALTQGAAGEAKIQEPPTDSMTEAEQDEDIRREAVDRFVHPDTLELGRLMMIAVWRLGLTRQPILEVFLRWLASGDPVLATGDLRYVELRVPCRRTGDLMTRTVFFDNFSTAYLLIERDRLRPVIKQVFGLRRSRRHRRWFSALKPYLSSIGAPASSFSLPSMMAAAVQRILLRSSPLLAAYSCGEFSTEDLDDSELRRLAGLEPGRGKSKPDVQKPAPSVIEPDAEHNDRWIDEPLPKDLRSAKVNFAHALTGFSSPFYGELMRRLPAVPAESNVERLLRSFAIHLLKQEEDFLDRGKIPRQRRDVWGRRIRVVCYGLMGMADTQGELLRLSMADIERISELTAEHFPDDAVHGAWYAFKAFLRRGQAQSKSKKPIKVEERVDLVGVAVGDLGDNADYEVSAKILTVDVIRQIDNRLSSVLCGITNSRHRRSARRLFQLLVDTGARRAEIEHLRAIDIQGDLIRIQAYDDHSLKTSWSERVVPVDFLSPETKAWVRDVRRQGLTRIIDVEAGKVTKGFNVFDAINKVIQQFGRDEELGLHHLRHTMASRLELSMMADVVEFEAVAGDLPWLMPLLIKGDRLDCLLGGEGPSGQGLQALSGLIGHSHPTTSLRHYVHTLGVSFYAYLAQEESKEDISRCFFRRIRTPKTVERWGTEARAVTAKISDARRQQAAINRCIRDEVERVIRTGLDVDETQASVIQGESSSQASVPDADRTLPDTLDFFRIERIDQYFREEGPEPPDSWVGRAREGLEWLAAIPSGKPGSSVPRHPLSREGSLAPLPEALIAGTGSSAAVSVLAFLENLRTTVPEEFSWVLQKWAHASESERGRMRLDGDGEKERAEKLPGSHGLAVEIQEAVVTASKVGRTRPTLRMRIRYVKEGKFSRDSHAIRWALTWATALFGVRE